MTRSLLRPALLALSALLLLDGGCSPESRWARHLAKGTRDANSGDYDSAEIEFRKALQIKPDDTVAAGQYGTLLFNEGRVLPGYLFLRRAVVRGSKDPKVRLTLGLAALTVERIAEARDAARFVLQTEPTNEDALVLLANTSITARDADEAQRLIATLQSQNPDAAGFHLALGALRFQVNDLTGAETELKRALALNPKSAASYVELGAIYQARNDLKQAGEAYKAASDLSPLRAPLRLKYSDFLVRTGKADEAKIELARITAQAPDYLPAWIAIMHLAYAESRYDDCVAAAKKILDRDPVNYDALMQRADVRIAQDDPDAALVDLQRVSGYYTQVAEVRFKIAGAYLKKHDTGQAAEYLHQAIILAPNFEEAIVDLARLDLQKGDPASAVALLEPMIKGRGHASGQVYLLLAQAYRAQGNLGPTLGILRLLEQAAPTLPEPPYLVGTVLLDLQRAGEARTEFEHSMSLGAQYWPSLEMLVNLDLQAHHPDAALARVHAAQQKFPKAAPLYMFLAKIHLVERDNAAAETDLTQAIALDPNAEHAYLDLARIYYADNHAQQALDNLNALAARASTVSVQMQIALLNSSLGHPDAAQEAYERALTLDPKFVPALNNLAVIKSDHSDQLDQALHLAQTARDLAPSDTVVADTVGWILFRRGEYDSALPLLQESVDHSPGEPENLYHLGMAQYMLGNAEQARRAFEGCVAALTDAPVKADARRRLQILSLDPLKADAAVQAMLEQDLKQEPNDPFARLRLGAIEQRDGAASDAAANYEAVIKIIPHDAALMVTLAQLYAGPLSNPDRARTLAKAAHELAPTDAKMSWTLARVHYRIGDYAWSANLLQEAARDLPSEPALLFDLARGYYSVGNLAETENQLTQLLNGDAPGPLRTAAQRLQVMMAAAKSPDRAQAALPAASQILAAEPDYIPALMVTALAQNQQGDYPGAQQTYEKILSNDPLFAPATRELAILYAERLGDDKKAEVLVTKARETYPDDPQLAYELGVLNYRRANYADAVRYLEQSLSNRDNDSETTYYLGMAHFQLKDHSAAKDELQKALDLNLTGRDAEDAKQVLDQLNRGDASLSVLPGT